MLTAAETDLALSVQLHEKKANWYDLRRIAKPRFAALDKIIKKRLVACSCGGVLLLTIAILLFVNESSYQRTVACCESTDFAGAYKAIGSAFLLYRDTRTLNDLVSAGLYLEVGQYQEAKDRFLALGDYRNAQDMVLECDYQKAYALLNSQEHEAAKALFVALRSYSDATRMAMECDYRLAKDLLQKDNYDKARSLFTELAKSSFRDSGTMVQETDYQKAKDIFDKYVKAEPENRRYVAISESLALFKSLDNYLDSKAMLEKVKGEIYKEALYIFNEDINCIYFEDCTSDMFDKVWGLQSNLNNVKQYFLLVEDYSDSQQYMKLCDSLYQSETEQEYRLLLTLWYFIPARNIIFSDWYFEYFLLGTWRSDGHYFRISERGDESFYSSYDIPWISGKYYKIENMVYYAGSDEDGWRRMYSLTAINEDEIEIYAYKNGETYTLYRQ